MNLDTLLNSADLWRGRDALPPPRPSIATGFAALDNLLPGGGWPVGTITEILSPREGLGAVRLTLPALARLSRGKRWLTWVAPPYIPYAPALASAGIDLSRVLLVHPRAAADRLWAVEQALRSGTCSVVLAWLSGADTKTLRRLQLAAAAGECWGLLFRPHWAADQSSPAALRLRLEPVAHGLDVHILKRRGGWATGPLHLDFATPSGTI